MDDLVDATRGYTDILGQPVLRNTERLEKICGEDFAWMNGLKLAMGHAWITSVIVYDLHVVRVAVLPAKADPPLIIDANTVLPGAVAFEFLEPVPRRDSQVRELLGGVDKDQLSQYQPVKFGRKATGRLTPLDRAGDARMA